MWGKCSPYCISSHMIVLLPLKNEILRLMTQFCGNVSLVPSNGQYQQWDLDTIRKGGGNRGEEQNPILNTICTILVSPSQGTIEFKIIQIKGEDLSCWTASQRKRLNKEGHFTCEKRWQTGVWWKSTKLWIEGGQLPCTSHEKRAIGYPISLTDNRL